MIPCVCSVAPTALNGLFPYYLAQMITSIRGYAVCNGFWLRVGIVNIVQPLLCNKTDKSMVHIFVSVLQCIQFWMDYFNIRHKWSLVWESCAIIFDLGIWLHCHLAMTLQQKLLKYYTSCCVRSITSAVLNGLFSYVPQMITSMKCVRHNDFDIGL